MSYFYVSSGYEVEGIEKIPDDGPALFVFYHGAIPVDLYYFLSRVFLLKNRLIHTVADRFLFKIPGLIFVYVVYVNLISLCNVTDLVLTCFQGFRLFRKH